MQESKTSRILVVCQIVDENDPVLGYFVTWIKLLAGHFEQVDVICLKQGIFSLPSNVDVYSLGKEQRKAHAFIYGYRFVKRLLQLHFSYKKVFVHMNQEYVVLAGWWWRLLGRPVYLWRNHYAGSWLTDIAAFFCTKLFYTSRYSYTSKYSHAIKMPVGVDEVEFHKNNNGLRNNTSILFLSRISPSKRPELFIDALTLLARERVAFTATIAGGPQKDDQAYYEKIKKKVEDAGIASMVTFPGEIIRENTPDVFRNNSIFVNCSPSGMYDKTMFEAAATGAIVIATSEDWKLLAGEMYWSDSNPEYLAQKLKNALSLSTIERNSASEHLFKQAVKPNTVSVLIEEICKELK